MNYPLLIFFGLAPSIIWLLFFLRKDAHPESNIMVLRAFGYGMMAALPAALIELGILTQLESISLPPLFALWILCLIGVALPEEMMKYLAVRVKVLRSPEFDEPIDIMLFMIIAALGFAALENILLLFPFKSALDFFAASWLRLVGATFLHALCAGVIGYFLALSFFRIKEKLKLTLFGLTLAITLHGLYNFSIMIGGTIKWMGPVIILTALAIFVSFGFKKIKKLKSICLFSKK